MHESFFGLQKRPFLAVPTLDRYCPVASQETAFQSCARAIARAEGPVAILGGTGLGKSMLCLRIGEVFRRSFEVILLSSSQICSRRALLQSLLFELRMPFRDLSEGELRLSLLDRLQPSNENPSDGLVLIVDEAQTLSMKLLDELRLITNLTRDGLPRVRLVLCGTLRLEEMLGHPQLESLNQRLACRCYLAPLNQHETLCYITHKIELCGATIHSVFTDEALRLIHRATDGIPRLIDQLADQALRLASESKQRPVSASMIESAWASLQQIPLPWSDTGSPIARSDASIEYGTLQDESDSDFSYEETMPSSVGFPASQSSNLYFPASEPTLDEANVQVERPIVSPVPSAGMGLSRVAPIASTATPSYESHGSYDAPESYETQESYELPSSYESSSAIDQQPSFKDLSATELYESAEVTEETSQASPSSVVAEAWDDFVSPSDRRFATGAIEDYVEDLLDFTTDGPSPASPIPETVDFVPFCEPVAQSVDDRAWMMPTNETASQSNEDLFGTDFEDEVEVQWQPQSNADLAASESIVMEAYPSPPIADPNYAFEYNSIAQFSVDESLQPYTELLDTLSTANLEAMTLDPRDSFPTEPSRDELTEPARTEADFGGGLSRQTRSTILSFADLQETRQRIVSDDRDILIIEDDLPAHSSEQNSDAATPASVQPYKQLFSKLRG